MKPVRLLALVLLLAACREEAVLPDPVELTPESVGFFCQMNLLEHAGPKGQVHLAELPGRPLFFSQVRDAVAYLRMPEQDYTVSAAYASDMGQAESWADPGPGHWVALEKAFFVVGSDMMGAMDQPELVPFAAETAAQAFAQAHGGQVMTLAQIPTEATLPPAAEDSGTEDYAARLKSQTGG